MSKHFLSVVSIFKNEDHVLKEWLDHYIAEGVDHFYLIDNNSTDNWEEILVPYIDSGRVTLFREKRNHYQTAAYNELVFPIRDESEWLAVVDLDEFVYGRTGKVSDFIKSLHFSVNGIRLPWVCFGSSGNIVQPKSVIDGFRSRRRYDNGSMERAKSIVRTRNVGCLNIHVHTINGWVVVDGRRVPVANESSGEQDEGRIRDSELLLNHYRVQSLRWYTKTKMTRGYAINPVTAFLAEGYRLDEKFFIENDFNDVVDDTLAAKRGFTTRLETGV